MAKSKATTTDKAVNIWIPDENAHSVKGLSTAYLERLLDVLIRERLELDLADNLTDDDLKCYGKLDNLIVEIDDTLYQRDLAHQSALEMIATARYYTSRRETLMNHLEAIGASKWQLPYV